MGPGQMLLADHERMEGMLKELFQLAQGLVEAEPPTSRRFGYEEPDPKYEAMKNQVQQKWVAIETSLMNHLAAEETFLFPQLRQVDMQEAMALAGEHQAIRTAWTQIGSGLAIATSPLTHQFAQLLTAHTKRETALLYAWANAQAPANIVDPLRIRLKRTFVEL